jgi:hypothetical protein
MRPIKKEIILSIKSALFYSLVLVTLSLVLIDCNKQDSLQLEENIYVAGYERDSTTGKLLARYWKNGVAINLGSGLATAIAVVGTNVYVAGYDGGRNAKYWKNETQVPLTNSIGATSIKVVGSDVYVGGYGDNGLSNTARYWKNASVVYLPVQQMSQVNSITVAGDEVYTAGNESNGKNSVAKYWKNDVAVNLTDGSNNASANSMVTSGDNVYVAGFEFNGTKDVAKYWKNGKAVNLTDGSNHAVANSIVVSGDNVYVAGHEANEKKI